MEVRSGRILRSAALALLTCCVLACTTSAIDKSDDSAPNFIVLIGDDMGVETLAAYGVGATPAVTPNLDRLAGRGVLFENFWAQPICSPTRATLLTGRYGFRTNVLLPVLPREDLFPAVRPPVASNARKELQYHPITGYLGTGTPQGGLPPWVKPGSPADGGLPAREVTLPAILKSLPANYATAAVGKWHLADSANGWLDHPNLSGFDYYSGVLLGEGDSYQRWLHVEDGEASGESGYIDSRTVDDGIAWLQSREENGQPWLLWVGFVNPHVPIHLPPAELLHSEQALALDESGLTDDNVRPYVMAMIEAMDSLIGRLLDAVPPDEQDHTWIIFLGDNGTARWAQPAPPFDDGRVKMTVYEGGLRTPLIVAGPRGLRNTRSDALINSTDIFNTVIELAAGSLSDSIADTRPIDGVSFVDVLQGGAGTRDWIFADTTWGGTYSHAIRDRHFKLVTGKGGEELFDLVADPWETRNLLADELDDDAVAAYAKLEAILDDLLPAEPPEITRPFR
ncbi:MAG: sulfatase-like hydrolase/transferase [Woeseiaceae bacterium]